MAEKKKNRPNNSKNNQPNDFIRYSSIAAQTIVVIGLCFFAGYKLDQHFGNEKPILTAILSFLGVFAGLYLAIRDFIKK